MKLYAHENGCSWDGSTCITASTYGHLECLRYAHENGCYINIVDCLGNAKGDCIKYLENLMRNHEYLKIENTNS